MLAKLSCASSLESVSTAQPLGAVFDAAEALDVDVNYNSPSLHFGPAGRYCRAQHGKWPPPQQAGVCSQAGTADHLTAPACLVQLQARLRMQEQFQEDMQGGMQTSIAWDVRQTQASPA